MIATEDIVTPTWGVIHKGVEVFVTEHPSGLFYVREVGMSRRKSMLMTAEQVAEVTR